MLCSRTTSTPSDPIMPTIHAAIPPTLPATFHNLRYTHARRRYNQATIKKATARFI